MANEMQRYRNGHLARPLPQRREPERVRVPDDDAIPYYRERDWTPLIMALVAIIIFELVFMALVMIVLVPRLPA